MFNTFPTLDGPAGKSVIVKVPGFPVPKTIVVILFGVTSAVLRLVYAEVLV